jgi:hypothetical protein
MAQAVSRRPLTAEARVRSRVSPCGIYGGQSDTGTGFSPSISGSPYQFHATSASLLGKTKKKTLIVFVTGLHNKPEGSAASVASAAGSFTIKKCNLWMYAYKLEGEITWNTACKGSSANQEQNLLLRKFMNENVCSQMYVLSNSVKSSLCERFDGVQIFR